MKRLLIVLCIFGPSVVIAFSVSAVRSIRVSAGREVENRTGVVIAPAGTRLRIRLVGGISNAAGSGDIRQAITVDPAMDGTQTLIPAQTRALVRVLRLERRPGSKALVTLQIQNLMSQNRTIPVHSDVVTTELNRASDLDVMQRGAAGLIGAAVGAATSAVVKNNPGVGEAAIGGLAAGTGTEDGEEATVTFQILDPIDLTGIRW